VDEYLVNLVKIKYFIFSTPNPNDGVNKKLLGQVSELNRLDLDVEMVLVCIGDVYYPSYDYLTTYRVDRVWTGNFFGWIKLFHEINKIFGKTIDSLGSDDILYYRYDGPFPVYHPKSHRRGFRACKVVVEHQAKELEEFRLYDNPLMYWSEYLLGKSLRQQSDAIIGVTDEITRYEIAYAEDPTKPHLTIGNGFAVQSVPVRHAPDHDGDGLHLLCVANVSRWHGLDRLIRGLSTYNGMPKVILHIAGDGTELSYLQKLAGDLGISDRVVSHGFTTGKVLDTLFDQCHIAVGSLGIHRKGLTQTSELKGREYCTRGIPYIIACGDPDFPADFPYILHLPADESPIDIEQVLAFAREICTDLDHPQKMRRYAEEHLDWSAKMKKLKGFLETLVREGTDNSIQKPTRPLLPQKG